MEFIGMKKSGSCFLCENPAQDNDVENYILLRGAKNFVILNRYPYSPGHLMVAPYRHIDSPEDLTAEERNEHSEIVNQCLKALREEYAAEGFNIGVNLGKAAGAGVAGHVHTHVVPRWMGDTNFMQVLADVKVMPEALAETYKRLKSKF
jgi:ATP adenylyltransferase